MSQMSFPVGGLQHEHTSLHSQSIGEELQFGGDEFRQKARQILMAQSSVAAGVVHLLGLEQIQEELGEKWPLISERVHELAGRILRKQLGTCDAWIKYGDANYLIVFSNMKKSAAQLVCGKIKAELHELLLGRSETKTLTVKTATIDIDGRVLMEAQSLGNLLDSFASKASTIEKFMEENNEKEESSIFINSDHKFAFNSEISTNIEPNFMYRPVWDAYAQVISTYVCEPCLARPGFSQVHGYNILSDQEDAESILELDAKTFSEAIATYNELFQNCFRFVLTIPVHFETLANTKRRREYWQLCRMTPKYLVPFIAFELTGLPPGVPFGRLNEIVNILRPVCRTIIAQGRSEMVDFHIYAQSGIKAVGLEICTHADGAKVKQDIERFSALCRKAGVFPYADGVRTAWMLEMAEKAAFKYLAGPVIGKADSVPQHMSRCSAREILMRARIKATQRNL
ncbi:hypothetical protein [Azospirillum doebereinerae]